MLGEKKSCLDKFQLLLNANVLKNVGQIIKIRANAFIRKLFRNKFNDVLGNEKSFNVMKLQDYE